MLRTRPSSAGTLLDDDAAGVCVTLVPGSVTDGTSAGDLLTVGALTDFCTGMGSTNGSVPGGFTNPGSLADFCTELRSFGGSCCDPDSTGSITGSGSTTNCSVLGDFTVGSLTGSCTIAGSLTGSC